MSALAATVIGIATGVIVVIVWRKVAKDEVGTPPLRPSPDGVQGKVAYWLDETAPLRPPRPPSKPRKKGKADPESPAGRALAAMLREEMVRNRMGPDAAHEHLLNRSPGPVSHAFLTGRMRRAMILHTRSQYAGPPALFWPWFALIAMVRFGRRRLYLDTVTHAVREMRP